MALNLGATRHDALTTPTKLLEPNATLITKHIPRADDVLVGHSHYDHILDMPAYANN